MDEKECYQNDKAAKLHQKQLSIILYGHTNDPLNY